LKNSGVELISFSEGLDFSTVSGKLFYTLISAFAEFEKNVIGERVRAGLRNARTKGTRLGRPQVTADASKIATLRSQGASWRTISDTFGNQHQNGSKGSTKACGINLIAADAITPMDSMVIVGETHRGTIK
jgi:DNA invertase Pin-like site-specific DNA recombinase